MVIKYLNIKCIDDSCILTVIKNRLKNQCKFKQIPNVNHIKHHVLVVHSYRIAINILPNI